MAKDRAPSFQFYPRDFLASSAVSRMTPEAIGGYILLLCHAWDALEPGILDDDNGSLAMLSRLGEERWRACEIMIRRAFRETSREGRKVLVQDRMIAERKAQLERREKASHGARATNEMRWGSVARDNSSDRSSVSLASASASASATALEDLEPTPLVNGGAKRAPVDRVVVGLRKEWREAFDQHFWPAYPRKVAKEAARKSWERLFDAKLDLPAHEAILGRVCDGIDWYVKHEWANREAEKIPHPSTWLNQKRWEDAFDGTPKP